MTKKMKKKCKKWVIVVMLQALLLPSSTFATPEKLTQEQVLAELGVKIETKGKSLFDYSKVEMGQ